MDNASHAALRAALSGFRWSPALPHLPATSSFLKGSERKKRSGDPNSAELVQLCL